MPVTIAYTERPAEGAAPTVERRWTLTQRRPDATFEATARRYTIRNNTRRHLFVSIYGAQDGECTALKVAPNTTLRVDNGCVGVCPYTILGKQEEEILVECIKS